MSAGVYQIVNRVTGKRYIGSSVSVERRIYQHRRDLRKGRHHSRYLQASWNKHGESAFDFVPLLFCSVGNRLFYEQLMLDGMRPEYNGFPNARSPLGYRFPEEVKAKWRGRVFSAEHRAAISKAKKGKPIHTPESRKRMAEFNATHGLKPPSAKGLKRSPRNARKDGGSKDGEQTYARIQADG